VEEKKNQKPFSFSGKQDYWHLCHKSAGKYHVFYEKPNVAIKNCFVLHGFFSVFLVYTK
jgi:hypothetical protein